jgi:adenylate cyclase class IV
MQNKQNLELKHYCSDFKEVRNVLKKMGAVKDVVKSQKDYVFDLPKTKRDKKGRMKLRIEGDKIEVIYYERPDFIAGKETSSTVVLLKADPSTLEFLKVSLGVVVVVEKQREVWRKDNTVFHLDKVKGVGNLFEVELQKIGKITATDRVLFAKYQNDLLPHLGKVIKGSNIDLVLRASKK